MAAIPYSSQANGRFSKMDRGPERYADKLKRLGPKRMLLQMAQRLRDAVRGQGQPEMYPSAANQRRYQALKQIANALHIPISHVVLAYLTSQPFTTIPIVGPQTPAQLADCIAASELRLTPEQVRQIEVAGK